jgi:hypothetical protein
MTRVFQYDHSDIRRDQLITTLRAAGVPCRADSFVSFSESA